MGGLFSAPKPPPAPPPPPPPAPMPDPENPQVKEQKKADIIRQRATSGRASTILSQGGGGEKLGA